MIQTKSIKCRALKGNTQLLDGGAMFGNAPKEMWQKWIQPDDKNRIPLACNCLLVQTSDGKNLLFETGIGAFFEPKFKERYGVVESNHVLLDSLKNCGLEHTDIHAVILSHLHFDHAGGTLTAYDPNHPPELLFPNARYYVSEENWTRAQHPHPRDKASFVPVLNELLAASGRLVLIKNKTEHDLSPLVTFHFSNGHTPGLLLSEIHLDDGSLVFVSDLIPGFSWVHIPISMGYDRYPELVIDEKKQLLTELLPKNTKLFFTHDPLHVVGLLKCDKNGKFFAEPVNL
jgi:glyoxylase-like metal-dependent hydrolase (beta-lactamase superfamily II)